MSLTLEKLKSEISSHKKYKNLNQKEWEEKISLRTIDYKYKEIIEKLIGLYRKKINNVRRELRENGFDFKVVPCKDDGTMKTAEEIVTELETQFQNINFLKEKEERLLDKLACCIKELELRDAKLVKRSPHHTTYYIDYTNGSDSNDGLTTGNAWKTIAKYANVTVRTSGDIALVRANQTHDYSSSGVIDHDEDGDGSTWIQVIGCDSVVNDPWGDGSDVTPIFDFGAGSNALRFQGDRFWWYENIHIKNSGYSSGSIYISGSYNALSFVKLKNCTISDSAASNVEGINVTANCYVYLEGCEFYDTWTYSITNSGIVCIDDCIFNAGSVHPNPTCISNNGFMYICSSSFGETTSYSTAIFYPLGGNIFLRNVTYSGTLNTVDQGVQGDINFEDVDGTYGDHFNVSGMELGTVSKGTALPRSGGNPSYARMTPQAECCVLNPLTLGHPLKGFAQLWFEKDIEVTVTFYAVGSGTWTTDPGNSGGEGTAVLRCSYLSNASTAARTIIDSDEDLNGFDWVPFQVTFTPLQTGFAYFWFILGKYESARFVDIDIKPVVT